MSSKGEVEGEGIYSFVEFEEYKTHISVPDFFHTHFLFSFHFFIMYLCFSFLLSLTVVCPSYAFVGGRDDERY